MMTCMIQHTKTEQNFVFKCKTCKAKQITVISFYDLGVNLFVNWLENRDMILHEYRNVVLKFVQAYIFMDWDVVWFWYRHNYVKNLFEEYWPFSAILTFNDGNIAYVTQVLTCMHMCCANWLSTVDQTWSERCSRQNHKLINLHSNSQLASLLLSGAT